MEISLVSQRAGPHSIITIDDESKPTPHPDRILGKSEFFYLFAYHAILRKGGAVYSQTNKKIPTCLRSDPDEVQVCFYPLYHGIPHIFARHK